MVRLDEGLLLLGNRLDYFELGGVFVRADEVGVHV